MPGDWIYILGGTAVVPSALEDKLNDQPFYHFTVQRLSGVTRYGTAAGIAKQVKPSDGGEVIITTGENFPDSLSVSPPKQIPEKLSSLYLNTLSPKKIVVLGGTSVVSENVYTTLKSLQN